MTSAQLVNLKGKNLGEMTLDDAVFGVEPNTGVLYEALVRQLANARSGSANTKTRSEVRGGGRKPWRQKGTGRARAGSTRSPLWAGGGVTFGPKPRDYSLAMPKKMRQLALKSALAARKDALMVVKDFTDLKHAKTREMSAALKELGIQEKKVLLVLDYASPESHKVACSARNLPSVKVIHVNNLNVKDLMDCEAVLTSQSVIELIHERFKKAPDSTASGAKPATRVKAAKAELKITSEFEGEGKSKAKPKTEPRAEKAEPKATEKAPAKKAKAEPAEDKEAKPKSTKKPKTEK